LTGLIPDINVPEQLSVNEFGAGRRAYPGYSQQFVTSYPALIIGQDSQRALLPYWNPCTNKFGKSARKTDLKEEVKPQPHTRSIEK